MFRSAGVSPAFVRPNPAETLLLIESPTKLIQVRRGACTFTGSGFCDTLTLVAALRAPSVAPWFPSSPSGSSLASLRISPGRIASVYMLPQSNGQLKLR